MVSSLITVDELRTRLQRDLDDDFAAQACELATAQIQALTRQTLLRATHTETVQLTGRTVAGDWVAVATLRQRPVITVTTVSVAGSALAADLWTWRAELGLLCVANAGLQSATVTYTAGYDPVPGDLKAVALQLAAADVANPSGLVSERLGDYAVQYGDRAADIRIAAILARYQPHAGTVRVD